MQDYKLKAQLLHPHFQPLGLGEVVPHIGPSVILRRLLSLRVICKEFDSLVISEGLPQLAVKLGPRHWSLPQLPINIGLVDGPLTALLAAPQSLKLVALKVTYQVP